MEASDLFGKLVIEIAQPAIPLSAPALMEDTMPLPFLDAANDLMVRHSAMLASTIALLQA